MWKTSLAALIAVAVLAAGCAQQPDAPNAIAEAKKVVDQIPAAMESGNLDMFSGMMSHDSSLVVFGTDAAEYWVGYPEVEQAMKEQFAAFKDITFTVSEQKMEISPLLDAVWFSELVDWSMTVGDQPVDLQGLRLTGVMTKDPDPDGWKIVQMHFSMPVAGQAAEY